MRSIIAALQPFWCGEIASGRKNAEIRKSKPKLTEPFRCYMYCTKAAKLRFWRSKTYSYVDDRSHNAFDRCGNGMVIGEFICGGIIPLGNVATDPWDLLVGDSHEFKKGVQMGVLVTPGRSKMWLSTTSLSRLQISALIRHLRVGAM